MSKWHLSVWLCMSSLMCLDLTPWVSQGFSDVIRELVNAGTEVNRNPSLTPWV